VGLTVDKELNQRKQVFVGHLVEPKGGGLNTGKKAVCYTKKSEPTGGNAKV